MALLPGSPAIDAGNNAPDPPRRHHRPARLRPRRRRHRDIGAFESRGFDIAVAGGNDQQTPVNTSFADPLVVSVTSPYGEPVAGGVVTFTAPGSGAAATFPDGGTAAIDASGQASTVATANSVAGGYTVSASASGSPGASLSLTNESDTTLTSLATSLSPSVYSRAVTFTATVGAASPGSGSPTGTVTFVDGSDTIGTASLDSTDTATFTTADLAAGSHSITAVYGGDDNFAGSSSAALDQVVNQATPTISWANPAAITYGTPLGPDRLDASASVPGTFAYSPPASTVLDAGQDETLSTSFTPTDSTDYETVTLSVPIDVNPAPLSVAAASPADLLRPATSRTNRHAHRRGQQRRHHGQLYHHGDRDQPDRPLPGHGDP